MKKILLLLSLSFGLTAIAQNEKYTINITVGDAISAEEVYLLKVDLNEERLIGEEVDTIKITNKKAVISGLLSEIKDTPLAIIKGEGIDDAIFAFEGGNTEVNLNTKSLVKGTELNDKLYSFKSISAQLEDKLTELSAQLRDENISDEVKAKIMEEGQSVVDELYKNWRDFAKSNIKNPAGQFFTLTLMSNLNSEEMQEILADAPESFKENENIKNHLADLKARDEAQGIGQDYKNITLASPDGVNISLSDYIGKKELVLIDFWASWCGPCIREMPTLVKAYEQFKDKGFEIVGISLDNSKDAWLSAINRLEMTWAHMSDLKGWDSSAAQLYKIQSIPQTLLVNKEGKIVAANLRGDALISKVSSLLNK